MRVRVGAGVSLNVRVSGGGTGVPFLLVHGLSSNARLWDGVAAHLSGHPVYAVDLRSHGLSDRPPDGYDTATATADLDAVCAGLDLPAAIVAGQSWGGNVVGQFAARFVTSVPSRCGSWQSPPAPHRHSRACATSRCGRTGAATTTSTPSTPPPSRPTC